MSRDNKRIYFTICTWYTTFLPFAFSTPTPSPVPAHLLFLTFLTPAKCFMNVLGFTTRAIWRNESLVWHINILQSHVVIRFDFICINCYRRRRPNSIKCKTFTNRNRSYVLWLCVPTQCAEDPNRSAFHDQRHFHLTVITVSMGYLSKKRCLRTSGQVLKGRGGRA